MGPPRAQDHFIRSVIMLALESAAKSLLAHEAQALLTRLDRVKPLVLVESMLPAAALSVPAQTAIERCLVKGRRELRSRVHQYLTSLKGGVWEQAAEAQRRLTFLRLRFNDVLSQFDLFSTVVTQRSEDETGVWLSGLDVVATDALSLRERYYDVPPVACYLAKGPGAAIRRAKTPIPGGVDNPVALVRIPRERMVGSGIAASLFHEVGHQATALLDLLASIRPLLKGLQRKSCDRDMVWTIWERWISEILSDFWAVAKLGATATAGLMSVVSLPAAFVFRLNLDDPHPSPWIRVKLSCCLGSKLYPHSQWDMLSALWDRLYPLSLASHTEQRVFRMLQDSLPAFAAVLLLHRPPALHGKSLQEAVALPDRHPATLSRYYSTWRTNQSVWRHTSPSLALAVIGQARLDARLRPQEETNIVAMLLRYWALRSTLNMSEICAPLARSPFGIRALP